MFNDIGKLLYFTLDKPMTHDMIECNIGDTPSLQPMLSDDLWEDLRVDALKDTRGGVVSHFLTTDGAITLRDALRRTLVTPTDSGAYTEEKVNDKFVDLLPYFQYKSAQIPFFDTGIEESTGNIVAVNPTRIIFPECDFFFASDMAPEIIMTMDDITYDLKCLIIRSGPHFIVHYRTDHWYEYDDVKYGFRRNGSFSNESRHPQLDNPYQLSNRQGDYGENDFMVSLYIRRPA
jgi:hypothetical protein